MSNSTNTRRPFKHPSVSNPTGAFVLIDSQHRKSYICDLCNVSSSRSNNLVQHLQSATHQAVLMSTINNTPAIVSTVPRNDDNVNVGSLNQDADSTTTVDDMFNESIQGLDPLQGDPTSTVSWRDSLIRKTLADTFQDGSTNYLYFSNQVFGRGKAVLIAKCILHNTELKHLVTPQDERLQFKVMKLIRALSTPQRENLAEVLHEIYSFKASEDQSLLNCPLPTTADGIRTMYTRGKNSLLNSLPYPEVMDGPRDTNGRILFAYLSIKSCIAHFLGNGGVIQEYDTMCVRAKAKYQELNIPPNDDTAVLFINLWSDSFDINYTKNNRGKSLWIMTLRIVGDSDCRDMLSHTFPIGICQSSDNASQEKMIDHFISEVNLLFSQPTSFYYARENTSRNVFVSILAVLQDQPERRKRNGVLLGSSQSSCRWSYFVPNINEVYTRLPACDGCIRNNMNPTWEYNNQPDCSRCYNWDISRSPTHIKLSYEYLRTVLAECVMKASAADTTHNQLKYYANSKGLNEASSSLIWDHSENVKFKSHVTRQFEENNATTDDISPDSLYGTKYEQWRGCPMWQSLSHDVEDTPDVPMHLLCLGIVKTTIFHINKFISLHKISTVFDSIMTKKVAPLIHEFKLSWLVQIDFKRSGDLLDTIGWISENFLSMSRILKWFVSSLRLVVDSRHLYAAPNMLKKPIQKWSRTNLLLFAEKFMSTPDKPFRLMSMRDLRTHIKKFVSGVDPETLVDKSLDCSVDDVISLATALHDLMHSVMVTTASPCRTSIERNSRRFLTYLHKVCCNQGIDDCYMRYWNAQSLLNLGSIIERFGSVQAIWEGGINGEGMIQLFKKEKGCLTTNTGMRVILNNVLQRRSLDLILSDFGRVDTTVSRKMYHRYSSTFKIQMSLAQHLPLSVLWLTKQKIHCCVVGNSSKVQLYRISCKPMAEDDIGVWFDIHFKGNEDLLPEDPDVDISRNLDNLAIPQVFLPCVHTAEHKGYCIVSMSWDD
jgi:hypothetical protein